MKNRLSLGLGAMMLLLIPGQAWPRPAPLKIVTSIFPLQEFAKEIAAERAEVSLLLPPGAGVHTWQPRASDIVRLSGADLFVYVGAGLEPWIGGLLRSSSSPQLKVLAVADSLPLKEHADGEPGETGLDPHVWLDFGLNMMIADAIAAKLIELDPAGAAFFQAGAVRLKDKLAGLDAAYSQALKSCAGRIMVIGGHAAFGYLARRYGLEQLSLAGLSPDAEALPSRLMSAVTRGRENKVRAVFTEANSSPQRAEVLARELRAEVLVLHTAVNLSQKEWTSGLTFFDLMEENLLNLRRGLGCD
jgi:zinc transport system substrate-binding protein